MSIYHYSDRLKLRQNSLSGFSILSKRSDKTFYEQLDENIKRDIHTLINSGYNKNIVVKLYLIMKPKNVEEAIEFLSKKNGLNQHMFYPKLKRRNKCEICGDFEKNHIKEYEKSNIDREVKSQIDSSLITKENPAEKITIFKINKKYKCEICFESYEKDKLFECEKCKSLFCNECLFEHIEILIKEQKEIICANSNCRYIYKEKLIMNILSKNIKEEKKLKQFKNAFEKIKIKYLVLSNPNLIFCSIPGCDGYAKITDDSLRCICNRGHAFCFRCGEYWHKNEICPKDKAVDNLFENFVIKLNIKRCPSCGIYTIKKNGCNYIICTLCKKGWCYLCGQLIQTTQEHYENPNSGCFHRGNEEIIQLDICLLCDTPTKNKELIDFRKCNHLICKNCVLSYLNDNPSIEIEKTFNIKCPLEGCDKVTKFDNNNEIIIELLFKTNMKTIIKKLKWGKITLKNMFGFSHLTNLNGFSKILELIFCAGSLTSFCFELPFFCSAFLIPLTYFFFFIVSYSVPFYFQYCIRRFYYFDFIEVIKKEIKNEFFKKLLIIQISIGIELFSLIFFIASFPIYYIYMIFFLIYFLIFNILKLNF